MYLEGMKLVEIASQLNLPEGTVRRWKSTHKWENERSDKNSERSEKRKRGAQPGNKNSSGGPPGNKKAVTTGEGSPPLARGILLYSFLHKTHAGITPACAGNTLKKSHIYSLFPISTSKFHLVSQTPEMS